jgi:hypothetical protein
VRPQARLLIIERRDDMLHPMYGEIYGRMEYSLEAIHQPDTTRAGEERWRRWNFLGESDGGNAQKAKYWMFVRLRVVACTLLYLCIQDGRGTLHGSMGLIEGISMNHLFSNIIEIKCLRSRVSEYLYSHWY